MATTQKPTPATRTDPLASPRVVREWVRIFRDIAIVFVATFMLIFETVFAPSPNVYVIGAGLTLLGIPPALRLDEVLRGGKDRA